MLLSSLAVVLSLPSRLPHFQMKAQGFPLGSVYVVLLVKPLQNNVLHAITLLGLGPNSLLCLEISEVLEILFSKQPVETEVKD